MPVGRDNLILLDQSALQKDFIKEQKDRTDTSHQWKTGQLEFEALMRSMDNAGHETGYIYHQPMMRDLPGTESNNNETTNPPFASKFTTTITKDQLKTAQKQTVPTVVKSGKEEHAKTHEKPIEGFPSRHPRNKQNTPTSTFPPKTSRKRKTGVPIQPTPRTPGDCSKPKRYTPPVPTPKRRQKKIKVKDCSVLLTNFNSTPQQMTATTSITHHTHQTANTTYTTQPHTTNPQGLGFLFNNQQVQQHTQQNTQFQITDYVPLPINQQQYLLYTGQQHPYHTDQIQHLPVPPTLSSANLMATCTPMMMIGPTTTSYGDMYNLPTRQQPPVNIVYVTKETSIKYG
ncbi:adducin-related protein 1-like [Branchiostoma lanceolatum]|uniref:adducin-related protein 1-like n=1 Tax=Branchiostoma lanceolatum TaxID=7740 RepID=UPI0034552CC1